MLQLAIRTMYICSTAKNYLRSLIARQLMVVPAGTRAASFPVMAVLVFASSAFVPTQSMPNWLQAYADHQPVTATVDAMRALVLGGPTAGKVVTALVWSIGIVVVFAPLAVRRYRRAQ